MYPNSPSLHLGSWGKMNTGGLVDWARMRNLLILAALAAASAFGQAPEVSKARDLYARTRYDEALRLLESIASKDASVYGLAGKCHYMNGDFKKSSEDLERAVTLAPESADFYLWLGRAYGRRAETSSFLTAPGYASRARGNFEKAVALDPRNKDAVSDLFEYYLEAPGFLGGGLDKAQALAERTKAQDQAEYEYLLARIASKKKEYGAAEEHLRRAVELAPRQVGRVLALATFLARQGQFQESEAAFQRAQQIAPNDAQVIFERAKAYIQSGRNLDVARELLSHYLTLPLTPDNPPRQEAEQLLKKAQSG